MSEETYGRGRVEWALWSNFVRAGSSTPKVPPVFRTRIKRLLEIDRALDVSDAEMADYVFARPASEESGEVAYSAVDTFCLAIALDLLDAGFKQAEIVFLMRHLRSELEIRFEDLSTHEHRGRQDADGRVFVILQKVELTEIIPETVQERHTNPVILEPIFCAGVIELSEELSDIMPNRRRAVTVLEIAGIAQGVRTFLKDAPIIRRGRPKS